MNIDDRKALARFLSRQQMLLSAKAELMATNGELFRATDEQLNHLFAEVDTLKRWAKELLKEDPILEVQDQTPVDSSTITPERACHLADRLFDAGYRACSVAGYSRSCAEWADVVAALLIQRAAPVVEPRIKSPAEQRELRNGDLVWACHPEYSWMQCVFIMHEPTETALIYYRVRSPMGHIFVVSAFNFRLTPPDFEQAGSPK